MCGPRVLALSLSISRGPESFRSDAGTSKSAALATVCERLFAVAVAAAKIEGENA